MFWGLVGVWRVPSVLNLSSRFGLIGLSFPGKRKEVYCIDWIPPPRNGGTLSEIGDLSSARNVCTDSESFRPGNHCDSWNSSGSDSADSHSESFFQPGTTLRKALSNITEFERWANKIGAKAFVEIMDRSGLSA